MKEILFVTAHSLSTRDAGVSYTNQLLDELSKSCLIDVVTFHYRGQELSLDRTNIKIIKDVEISRYFKIAGCLGSFPMFPLFAARYSPELNSFISKLSEVAAQRRSLLTPLPPSPGTSIS